MTNEELNTQLYEKMSAELERYKSELSELPYYTLLEHAPEFTAKLDILLVQESRDLSDEQAAALLESDTPLDDIYQVLGGKDTNYLDLIADCMEERADQMIQERQDKSDSPAGWSYYLIADLKTWSENAENRSPLEHFDSFEAVKTRFMELRPLPYNSEIALNSSGVPHARLTVGIENSRGMSVADILQVRNGQNYLVDDFTRMPQLRDSPEVMSMLSRVGNEIGFDRIRPYEKTTEGTYRALPDMPFSRWENKYFSVNQRARDNREADDLAR